MTEFFIKAEDGKYISIKLNEIVTKEWEDKLIFIRIGTDENPADPDELQNILEALQDSLSIEGLNSSFLVSPYNIECSVVGSLREVEEKNICIEAKSTDDLSKLGELQKLAKEQLSGLTKRVVLLPSPITVEEFGQVKEILDRLKVRKARRRNF